jgi:superfamily II DNA/RNA helicase
MAQAARERALTRFREGKLQVLVATDVAARGIDVTGVTHVVNYTCPEDEKTYIHRIGRTGRAGASGLAVTFVSGSDARLVADLEKLLKSKIELEAVEFEEDRPRGRINDGRRAWREAGELGDPRDALDGPRTDAGSSTGREGAPRERAVRAPREGRATAPRDPFFDQPYEPPSTEAAPAWESAAKPAGSRISANIKTRRKVPALFKSA